jgi:uncharacterized membrane protein YfcA
VFAWLGAMAIGVSLGLLGSGGSILTVPVLVYLIGQDEKLAIAGSLAIVGAIALAGSLPYLKKKLVDWRTVVLFGIPGMAGTYIGAWLATWVSGLVQLALFAVVMLLASWQMLKPVVLDDTPHEPREVWKIGLDGLLVGVLTGLVGVGGGFLIVPALVHHCPQIIYRFLEVPGRARFTGPGAGLECHFDRNGTWRGRQFYRFAYSGSC